jgi:hypothetical protein
MGGVIDNDSQLHSQFAAARGSTATPSSKPAVGGSPRCAGHRLFPFMMIATCMLENHSHRRRRRSYFTTQSKSMSNVGAPRGARGWRQVGAPQRPLRPLVLRFISQRTGTLCGH